MNCPKEQNVSGQTSAYTSTSGLLSCGIDGQPQHLNWSRCGSLSSSFVGQVWAVEHGECWARRKDAFGLILLSGAVSLVSVQQGL